MPITREPMGTHKQYISDFLSDIVKSRMTPEALTVASRTKVTYQAPLSKKAPAIGQTPEIGGAVDTPNKPVYLNPSNRKIGQEIVASHELLHVLGMMSGAGVPQMDKETAQSVRQGYTGGAGLWSGIFYDLDTAMSKAFPGVKPGGEAYAELGSRAGYDINRIPENARPEYVRWFKPVLPGWQPSGNTMKQNARGEWSVGGG